jgi:hypothetical protein
MKTNKIIFGFILLSSFLFTQQIFSQAYVRVGRPYPYRYYRPVPPPPPVFYHPVSPPRYYYSAPVVVRPARIWVPGFWKYNRRGRVWINGYWH